MIFKDFLIDAMIWLAIMLMIISFAFVFYYIVDGVNTEVNNSQKTATITIYGGEAYNVKGQYENARNVKLGPNSVIFIHKGKKVVVCGNFVIEYN